METLQEIFSEIGNHTGKDIGCNDKGSLHSYLETYDNLFAPFRNGCAIMEIGLALGDSMKLFDRYFENSLIVGVDISVVFTPTEYKNDVKIIEADATKPDLLDKRENFRVQKFDIILDDASHMESDQVATFELCKHMMKPGGLYIIEDILNIGMSRPTFESLHDNCEILNFQPTSGKFADCLVIYRF